MYLAHREERPSRARRHEGVGRGRHGAPSRLSPVYTTSTRSWGRGEKSTECAADHTSFLARADAKCLFERGAGHFAYARRRGNLAGSEGKPSEWRQHAKCPQPDHTRGGPEVGQRLVAPSRGMLRPAAAISSCVRSCVNRSAHLRVPNRCDSCSSDCELPGHVRRAAARVLLVHRSRRASTRNRRLGDLGAGQLSSLERQSGPSTRSAHR